MKRFILVIVLILVICWLATQHYTLKSGRSKNGTYNIVLVNKKSGKIHVLVGN